MQSTGSSSNSDDVSVEPANKDAAAAEKERLLREIQDLKCIAKQCEWNLQTLRFKDVEGRATGKPLQGLEASSRKALTVEIDLQNDLYRFAGFRCIKFRRNEFVFNFSSTNGEQRDNTHAVQIFVKDGKGNLGKWVMPMSIDMNYILSKTPIDELRNLSVFVKNCKHNVDCYIARQEQFLSLEEHISNLKCCTLQSDIGFKQISLELCGVHDSESDRYINIIIHLLYHSDKARPYKIEVDITKSTLSNDAKQTLKICLKEFKISDLRTAFDKILTEDNSTFTWMRADDSESLLELNDTSTSSDEENFLVKLQSDQMRSLRKLRKKRELQKKWNKRKRQRNITNIESSEDNQEDNQEDSHSKAKVSRIESSRRILIKEKKTEKAMSVSKQGKINKNLLEEITPMHKPKVKLKQTKLNFQTHEATNSNTNEMSRVESRLRNKPDREQPKLAKLFTSTPLRNVNIQGVLSPSLDINNITSIKATRKAANKSDKSSDQDASSKVDNKKTQEKNSRVLRSRTITGLSSRVLSPNQRFTRSMAKN